MSNELFQLLGIKKSGIKNRLNIADDIMKGLPAIAITRVRDAINITDASFSTALGKSVKTISRIRKSKNSIPPDIGDRLFRIAEIYTLAHEVFEDQENARDWLLSPQIGLSNRIPLDVMSTEAGCREVEELLYRLDYGILS